MYELFQFLLLMGTVCCVCFAAYKAGKYEGWVEFMESYMEYFKEGGNDE